MFFTVSTKASYVGGLSNIGSTKTLLLSAPVKTLELTRLHVELMAGSQYPQTTRSLLKTGLLLFIELLLFVFSR